MKGAEFLRRLEKLAKARGVQVAYHGGKGKGRHGRVYLGQMCRDLGIKLNDL